MSAHQPGAAPPVAELRGLRRAFEGRVVLQNINLEIAPGEFLAIVGQSGCGKSTLLRALGGLDRGWDGHLHVRGPVAFGFQDARLLPWLRVWENVTFGITGPRGERYRLATQALTAVGLAAHAEAWPGTLSGGEAQRVALARSLVRTPALLLLDEPFGALDALTRLRMQALVHNLWRDKGFAAVLVTHDVEEAALLADRIAVLDRGRIADLYTVEAARPRRRTDASFEAARQRALRGLGIEDIDGAHAPPELSPA
ncbi:ABC transporter ATP-binding protein [Bradyrhizobium sp. U87765 SZCCT0131]|uniref:ABC transporter ATP-binding protein n=1 Tax=unclassified Bradyrhizobium TaxID=2631580 RepID=UPI001BA9395F|nr:MULTISPECIES: ABC transporter ATP-binding protein [unclassified Bradyrhizobium]MBR1222991.1 ABC transporter ATP-binding protein [Bradyrhizobium sp. U87765 SZCCT0131]MBR1262727.1 ABC transporter ATP-binding protein [Bradyrhizobium sp. U87765 SZCCT0134]MBR1308801.1 ABC transporter ATP-binding protein [Bradyrhizobium sp. U87765 SZCCT0110]MBR1318509.1 ABC transporter ATP-binding protein [Bradyrhizobium sp. U87765 SZCCT0109]MBR1352213.1 ABC transporter ATP-binding protein [Bradyrhizobium sp. U87